MTSAPADVAVRQRASWVPWAFLWAGVLAASVSAILVRYATDAEPFAISFWRCVGGAGILLPFATKGLRRMEPRQFKVPILAGVFLAAHFLTWLTSLELTSIASSVLLVTTTPVWTALIARFVFKESFRKAVWIGILVALAGTAIVSGGGGWSGSSIKGDVLALLGGITVGGYAIGGEIARRELGILEYAVVTYAAAGILVFFICVAANVPLWGYDAQTWWAIVGLIVGPQLLGHTVINFVLGDLDATTVSVAIMAEPIIATGLAFLIFDEAPSLLVYPGGLAILFGIYLVSTARREAAVVLE
jgi:drug/metabolite transporter (DMT)-like permease